MKRRPSCFLNQIAGHRTSHQLPSSDLNIWEMDSIIQTTLLVSLSFFSFLYEREREREWCRLLPALVLSVLQKEWLYQVPSVKLVSDGSYSQLTSLLERDNDETPTKVVQIENVSIAPTSSEPSAPLLHGALNAQRGRYRFHDGCQHTIKTCSEIHLSGTFFVLISFHHWICKRHHRQKISR